MCCVNVNILHMDGVVAQLGERWTTVLQMRRLTPGRVAAAQIND